MKPILLISVGIILSARAAKAQQPDTALLFLHYKFVYLRDTNDRTNPYKEDMVLAIGRHAGVYRSYERQLQEAQIKKDVQAQASAGGPVRINIRRTGTGTEYFAFPNDHKLVRMENLFGSKFLVTGSLPTISWQITADTATFGDLQCQKAMGHFKGRDYIAWFCPDLPLHIGPWELNGLPGVIVEAYDTKKEVQFLFDGIEKAATPIKTDDQASAQTPGKQSALPLPGMEDLYKDPNLIQLPENATKATDKEFAKVQEAARKDPNAFVQSMMASRNAGTPGENGPKMNMRVRSDGGTGPVINNPIELPEKP